MVLGHSWGVGVGASWEGLRAFLGCSGLGFDPLGLGFSLGFAEMGLGLRLFWGWKPH